MKIIVFKLLQPYVSMLVEAINESIKVQGYSLTLDIGISDFEIKLVFLRNCWII